MKTWFTYAIGSAAVIATLSFERSLTSYIVAGIALAASVGLPAILDALRSRIRMANLIPPVAGFLLALAAAGLSASLFQQLPVYALWAFTAVLTSSVSYTFYLYQREIGFGFQAAPAVAVAAAPVNQENRKDPSLKCLDTSIIIDGRIIDIASTGFLEGPFVVPNFVLREIQLISDSPDPIKRNRGRRGLDMLNQLQKREDLEVRISYKDYTDTREVDAKLMKLAHELGAKLVTNDFNLNKVAELQGITVLNINNLANALKPVVLPGEELEIQVVKEGKDENQGIGYLEDGTMVVIEHGGKLVGKKVFVSVTSVIQTNAGKMIFTKVISNRGSR